MPADKSHMATEHELVRFTRGSIIHVRSAKALERMVRDNPDSWARFNPWLSQAWPPGRKLTALYGTNMSSFFFFRGGEISGVCFL